MKHSPSCSHLAVCASALLAAAGLGCESPPPQPAPAKAAPAPIVTAPPVTTAATTPPPPAPIVYAEPGTGCAPGSRCLRVNAKGELDPAGEFTAQCTGRFPDFIDTKLPADHKGSFFKLSQDFPKAKPNPGPRPWKGIDFKTAEGADKYMYAVRKYFYDDLLSVDFVAENSKGAPWYHVPWMTYATHSREFVHGMTIERAIRPEEYAKYKIKQRATAVAVGYYNDIGAYSFGKVWADGNNPDPKAAQFEEGAVVFKLLYTSLAKEDFEDAADDFLDGAPEWQANVTVPPPQPPAPATGVRKVGPVRLIQIDIAVRDSDSKPTGWVFGTFAYNKAAKGATGWDRMVPVGVMWGNDPTLAKGETPKETIISSDAAEYAKNHLGLHGRLNGPVDNPVSACMSCHGAAQTPEVSHMIPPPLCDAKITTKCCKTEKDQLAWFRNLPGDVAFGDEKGDECVVKRVPSLVALDYSLQQAIAIGFARQYKNPCDSVGADAPRPAKVGKPPPSPNEPIER